MATLIDDNDEDGQLGKSIWWLLSIRCTSLQKEGDAHEHNGSAYFTFSSFCGFDLHR